MRHDPRPVRTGVHGAKGEFIRFYAMVTERGAEVRRLRAVFVPEEAIEGISYFGPAEEDFVDDDAWVHQYNWTSVSIGPGEAVVLGSVDDILRILGSQESQKSLTFVTNTPYILDGSFEPVKL